MARQPAEAVLGVGRLWKTPFSWCILFCCCELCSLPLRTALTGHAVVSPFPWSPEAMTVPLLRLKLPPLARELLPNAAHLTYSYRNWLGVRVWRATTARGHNPSRRSPRRGGAWRRGSAEPPPQRQLLATCRRGGRPRTRTWTPFCPMGCSRRKKTGPAVGPSTHPPPPWGRAALGAAHPIGWPLTT